MIHKWFDNLSKTIHMALVNKRRLKVSVWCLPEGARVAGIRRVTTDVHVRGAVAQARRAVAGHITSDLVLYYT
jgi:hypothetical protein